MTYIKAPYNFVPLSDKVFYPPWAKDISHDLPLEDGVSGSLELKITAETPIFIRNGYTKDDENTKNDNYKAFSNYKERYFIPATSIKGMIRNVLEIMSFSKMPVDERKRYSVRDWENNNLNLKSKQKEIRCGWLYKKNGNIYIDSCGKPYRINHKRIDEILGNKTFENHFSEKKGIDLSKTKKIGNKEFDPKTACFKYNLINNINLENIKFVKDDEYCNSNQKTRLKPALNSHDYIGTIVFTGQPDKWKLPRKPQGGKFYEFVFIDNESDKSEPILVNNEYFEQVNFIYQNSEDWKFWMEKFNKSQRIPIFFRLNNKNNKLIDFGLSFLYKLPYKNSVQDIVNQHQKPTGIDLAESIFGFINKEKQLKSRVQFSHAFLQDKAIIENIQKTTLGSPKASYYPNYIKQDGLNGIISGDYKTYNDKSALISGWKRYPIHDEPCPQPTNNPNLDFEFIPLSEGNIFTSKITYHNLKPLELGALISALTFHGNEGFYHTLGMAKPLGYGKIKLEIEGYNKKTFNKYLSIFEKEMNNLLGENKDNAWLNSNEIKELFSMANKPLPQMNKNDSPYMALNIQNERNEFALAKKNKEYLRPYSEISNFSEKINSPLLEEKRKIEAEETRLRIEKEEKAKQELENEKIRKTQLEEEKKEFRKKEALEKGLTFLSVINEYNKAKKLIDQYLHKINNKMIPKNQHKLLFEFIQKYYNSAKPRDQKDWNKPFEQSAPWKKVATWIGHEIAYDWYKIIINSN